MSMPPSPAWRDDERNCHLMGIINVTPDSFSDGGLCTSEEALAIHAQRMLQAGACCLDIGGESTRPGAQAVDEACERERVLPAVHILRRHYPEVLLSVDTRHAGVARAALAQGVRIINDISAGADPLLLEAVAAADAALVLMHMQGQPADMQQAPAYQDVVAEVSDFLAQRIERAVAAGVRRERILVDPGIGFGKTGAHNCALLAALATISTQCARPLLLGISRKSLLLKILGRELSWQERDHASHILHALLARHCALLRVHDVAGAQDALTLARAVDYGGI